MTEAIAALEWSKPRLWRYETGQVPIHPNDVGVMCQLYGADTALTEALKELARQSKSRGWWQDYADIPEWFQLFLGMESAASRIRHFESEVIPGLVQSPAYARAIIVAAALAGEPSPEVVDLRAAVRQKRQQILTRREPKAAHLEIILSEAALLRGFSSQVMVDQLSNLLALGERPNLSIRVMPLAAGLHKGFHGPFVILEFPRETSARDPEPTTIYQEHPTGSLYLDKPSEVGMYESIWNDLDKRAADQIDSRKLIGDIKERWSRE
ncbi:transcriptional regulator [Actinoplanes lobatus]|uniref:Transcriptional regulator n=2 Tax=Actinoplanes lobatus TaxID=113568 RepID=A0A7W7HHM1_9ACTN|nr:hypothetical protein [Actinoplanes lobatus]GGN68961.1 transcriptional regulator [Actinoplanes lobatus]GIE42153.1 transcriptional regulator [Actinoplanes lobatus]